MVVGEAHGGLLTLVGYPGSATDGGSYALFECDMKGHQSQVDTRQQEHWQKATSSTIEEA